MSESRIGVSGFAVGASDSQWGEAGVERSGESAAPHCFALSRAGEKPWLKSICGVDSLPLD